MEKQTRFKKRGFFSWRYVPFESRRAYRLAFLLFWSILLTLFFQRFVIGVGIVTDRSMLPILSEGTTFLINKYIYHFTRPKRFDVVVFQMNYPQPEKLVKRVIALEAETLSIVGGSVLVDGRPLSEPHAVGKTYPDLGPILIERGSCFLLGDNRQESYDSRHFGTVPLRKVEGKIQPGKLFPLS